MPGRLPATVLFALLGLGCAGEPEAESPTQTMFGGDRPAQLLVPDDYDHDQTYPLVLVLHGHSVTGALELAYSRLGKLPARGRALVLAPDGLMNSEGNQYWKIDNQGCVFEADGPDDVAYLMALVNEITAVYNVDPQRVFVFGHSNGGFMAYQLACEHSEMFAAIISLAGSTSASPLDCAPAEPVSILQIHGDADDTVPYEGGHEIIGMPCEHPSAPAMARQWASYNGCTGALVRDKTLDLENPTGETDTHVQQISDCPAGIGVELWTIEGGGHIPAFGNAIGQSLWSFFEAHPKN